MTGRNLTIEEIIEMAIGIERSGEAFYSGLKELAAPGEVRDTFSTLESDERRHIRDFEKILQEALARRGGLAYTGSEEELLYLRAFANHAVLASPDQAARRAAALRDAVQGIDLALDLEFRSVAFYQDMARIIEDPKDLSSVREIERQERDHAAKLYRLREKAAGSR